MGEVYRARDPRLGRDVAIKVLPASFSSDPDRLRRFEAEARAAGLLNHPNVTAVYDIGTDDGGTPYVVSELLEGETLRAALAGGRLSPRRAVDYALQIAHGLAAAHEKGIVHRDLKPENVFVTRDGRAKILDFGLAKLIMPSGSGAVTNVPTATAGTEPGVVLGTLGYMSPEQVRGREADARSDIFSFGAILYEMLAGKRAFAGDSAADTMSAILREDPPDLSVTNANVSPGLDRVVRHCLEKNPEQRFHSAHDLAFDLEALSGFSGPRSGAPGAASPRGALRRAITAALALLLALAAGFFAGRLSSPPPGAPPSVRLLTYSGHDWDPSASPDGRTMAFTSTRDGKSRIWLKQLGGGGEVAITDGQQDSRPRFSADGGSVLFTRRQGDSDALYRISVLGGDPKRLVADGATHGDWSLDGRRLVFLRFAFENGVETSILFTANADGTSEHEIARLPKIHLRRPRWTPDGTEIVATQSGEAVSGRSLFWRISADGRTRKVFEPPEARGLLSAIAWSDDSLVYIQGDTGSLRATTGRILLQKIGSSRADVLLHVPYAGTEIDVAGPGRLLFDADSSRETLRETALGAGGAPGSAAPSRWLAQGNGTNRQPVYSPDGSSILFASDRSGNYDLWRFSTKDGSLTRLTEDPAEDWDPMVTPDGKHLLWSSDRTGHFEVWMADAEGGGARQVTHDGTDAENPSMTPDGQWIIYCSGAPDHGGLWKIRPDGSEATRLVAGGIVHPEISPDGRFVLYHVADTSLRVVELRGGRVLPLVIPIHSFFGVGRSRWLPDGRSIATVRTDEAGRTGVVIQTFSESAVDTSATRRALAGFDPDRPTESFGFSPDGSRIVLSELEERSEIFVADGVRGVRRPGAPN
jgi:Tol biopolymer transport system component